mgnify:CR=1 FL=1
MSVILIETETHDKLDNFTNSPKQVCREIYILLKSRLLQKIIHISYSIFIKIIVYHNLSKNQSITKNNYQKKKIQLNLNSVFLDLFQFIFTCKKNYILTRYTAKKC